MSRVSASRGLYFAVIVAVVSMRMVQVAIDEVVDVITVGNGGVTAVRAVLVALFVLAAIVLRRAIGGIGRADVERVLFNASLAHVVQVAVVEVVDVIVVLDPLVASVRPMLVRVSGVMIHFGFSSSFCL
jgi:hypothetical protein